MKPPVCVNTVTGILHKWFIGNFRSVSISAPNCVYHLVKEVIYYIKRRLEKVVLKLLVFMKYLQIF